MQQVALFRAVMDKAYGTSSSLSVERFRGICERYRQNRLCGYGEQIVEEAGKEGAVAKEKLEELYVALKYTQVAGRSIHCAVHPPPQNPPLPQLSHTLQSLASKLTQRYRNLPSAFLKFDQDHDGFISLSEFQQGLSDLGLAYSDSQSQEMFTLLDIDRTGLLSLAAFSKLKGDPYFPAIRGRERYASQPPQTLLEPQPIAHKMHVRLPSDHDPRFTYGAPTVFSDDIRDILSNSYEKAYLEAIKRREERRKVRKGRKAK